MRIFRILARPVRMPRTQTSPSRRQGDYILNAMNVGHFLDRQRNTFFIERHDDLKHFQRIPLGELLSPGVDIDLFAKNFGDDSNDFL